MNKMLTFVTVFAALLALGLGGAYYFAGTADPFLLKPSDRKIVALGKNIYQENCASCHGDNLQGESNWQTPDAEGYLPAPPHDETGHTWHHTDDVLFGLTKYGVAKFANLENHKSNMPAYQEVLSDEEIIAVLSFIKSTWPEEVKKVHDERNQIVSERGRK